MANKQWPLLVRKRETRVETQGFQERGHWEFAVAKKAFWERWIFLPGWSRILYFLFETPKRLHMQEWT